MPPAEPGDIRVLTTPLADGTGGESFVRVDVRVTGIDPIVSQRTKSRRRSVPEHVGEGGTLTLE